MRRAWKTNPAFPTLGGKYVDSLSLLVVRVRHARVHGHDNQLARASEGIIMYRIAENVRVVQIFAIFADRSASSKIKTAKFAASAISIALCFRVRAGAAKIKTTKISSGTRRSDSAKFCTHENFPLYGNTALASVHVHVNQSKSASCRIMTLFHFLDGFFTVPR